MEKLKITARTNWSGGFYIKFKAEEKSMTILKKFIEEINPDYFLDTFVIPKTFSKYNRWKDIWLPISNEKLGAYIVCGDKYIHMIIHECNDFEFITNLFHSYCIWIEPKRVKSNRYKTKRIKREK